MGKNLPAMQETFSVRFQGKPFNITVIQVYAPTSNAEEAEVERCYEDLQDLLELTPKKDVLFIIGDWTAKVGSQETPGVTGKFGLGVSIHFQVRRFSHGLCICLCSKPQLHLNLADTVSFLAASAGPAPWTGTQEAVSKTISLRRTIYSLLCACQQSS